MKEPYKVPDKDGKIVVGQIDRQRGSILLPGTIDDYITNRGPSEREWRWRDDETDWFYPVEFEGKSLNKGAEYREMLRKRVYDGLQ